MRIPMVCRAVARIERYCLCKGAFGFAKIPAVVKQGVAQRGVSLRESRIQAQRLFGVSDTFAKAFLWRKNAAFPTCQCIVCVGQPGVGESIFGISLDRLLEAFNRSICSGRTLFPIVAALEIQAICLRIFS